MIRMQQQPIDATPITKDDAISTTENDGQPSTEASSIDHEICSSFTLPQIIEDHESSDTDDGTIYDIDVLEHDPGLRPLLNAYAVNERNAVRRGYIAVGPCQPRDHDFPRTKIAGIMHKFSVK
jgi:hypothetical protein